MTLFRYILNIPKWLSTHIVFLFILWAIWLTFSYFAFGSMSYVRIHDNGDSTLAFQLSLASRLLSGQLGYWDPRLMSGGDTLAASQIIPSSILLLTIFPGWLGYGLFTWLQRFVAGYFTFRLLKDSLKAKTWVSTYAGMTYSLFAQLGIVMSWSGFKLNDGLGLPALPFFLWAFSRIDTTQRYRSYLLAIGLGVLFSINVLYAFAPFTLIAILFWFLLVQPRLKPKFWLLLLVFISTVAICNLPFIWASFLNSALSHRADRSPNLSLTLSQSFGKWVERALQHIKDNAIPLVLTFVGLLISRGRSRRLIALTSLIIFCFAWTVAYPLIAVLQEKYLGFLSSFQISRIRLLIPFLVTVSAALGLHWISRGLGEKPVRMTTTSRPFFLEGVPVKKLLIIAVISLVIWQSLGIQRKILSEFKDGSRFADLYQQSDIQQLSKRSQSSSPFRVATVFGSWSRPSEPHPAYAWSYGLETVDGYLNLYPERYQVFWEQVIAPLTRTDKKLYDYLHSWGNRVYLFPPSEGFKKESEIPFEKFYNLELLSLANVKYIISPVTLQDRHLKLLPSSTRDKQLAWQNMHWQSKLLSFLHSDYPGTPIYIYENLETLPRFFLVSKTRIFNSSRETLNTMGKGTFDELRSTAYLNRADIPEDISLALHGSSINAQVSIRKYSSDKIMLNVNTTEPSILITTNNYSPFWKATIDGTETQVFPVNQTFQGVLVSIGQHEVILKYTPPYSKLNLRP